MLALGWERLPPQGRVVGIPGLVVGVVAQGVRVDLGRPGFAVVPGEAAVDGVGPLIVQAHRVQGQAPLGRQLRQVPPLAVEVIADFVSCLGLKGGGDKNNQLHTRKTVSSRRSCTVPAADQNTYRYVSRRNPCHLPALIFALEQSFGCHCDRFSYMQTKPCCP